MPDLAAQSASAPDSPDHPAPSDPLGPPAVPPTLDPGAWEEFAVFRETFLMYLTPPQYAAAVRVVGEMLFALVLEGAREWPAWSESATRTELRAALADVRQLEGFLASVGREREVSSLDAQDEALSEFAAVQTRELARIADEIADALAQP